MLSTFTPKDMKQTLTLITAIALSLTSTVSVRAALPDQETYDFVTERYSLLLEDTRSGCSNYANPATLSQASDNSPLLTVRVLQMRGEVGGSLCNGVFEFKQLNVNCQTAEVMYRDLIGSPANWTEQPYQNEDLANKVCSLL
ncbi:hypothetical protein NDA01_12195 [Trichocoleus desertorum AS-A10]|uniref:hypothetical protein n=1 Tax=Trichocoleus desertorum TaxID=1481672 RepID=UPI00329684BA